MTWPTREAAAYLLATYYKETGSDARDALTRCMDETLAEAAPLLAAGDPERAGFALLLALGSRGSKEREAVEMALEGNRPGRVSRDGFLHTLALALWHAGVEAEVRALRTRPPAVALAIQRALVTTFLAPGRLTPVLDPTGHLELRDGDGRVLAATPALPVAVAALLARRHTALVSMNGQRVLRALATLGHRQAVLKEPDPRVLRFRGGLEACARAAGLKDRDDPDSASQDLRTILDAGQHFHGWFPGGEVGGLWTYVLEPSSGGRRGDPGRPAMLRIVLTTALLPDAVYALADPWLQPVTPMPPRFGDYPAEWPRQAAFETELLGLFVRNHREELVDEGGARLRDVELREAAERVGLAVRRVGPLMEYWVQPDDAQPLLERVEGGRWHLADNNVYRAARAFLNAAGEKSKAARRRALRGRGKG